MRLIAIAFIALAACAEQAQVPPGPQTEQEKKLYAVGLSVAGNTLGTFKGEFTPEEVAMIAEGFKAGMVEAEPAIEMNEYGQELNDYLQQRFENVQARAQEQHDGQLRWTRHRLRRRSAHAFGRRGAASERDPCAQRGSEVVYDLAPRPDPHSSDTSSHCR